MKKYLFYIALMCVPFSSFAVVSPAFSAHVEISEKRAKAGKTMKPRDTNKRQWVALSMCVLGGWFGLHRFYLGYNGLGVIYLLTFGLFGIGWVIDTLLLLVPGGISPKGSKKF